MKRDSMLTPKKVGNKSQNFHRLLDAALHQEDDENEIE